MSPTWFVFLLAALLPFASPQKGAGDEALADFKKYFPTFQENAQRIEAILALEGLDGAPLVETLLPLVADPEIEIRGAVVRVLSKIRSEAAVSALIASFKTKKSETKAGAAEVLGLGRHPQAVGPLKLLAADSSPEVRAAAALALGRIRDREGNEALLKLLEDGKDVVRTAACDALGWIGDAGTADAVIAKLADREWRVRAAAIAALGSLRATQVVPRLIESMEKEEGRLVEDSSRSLERLTGIELGPDAQAWRDWWKQVEKGYQIPSEQALKEFKEKQRKAALKYGLRKDVVEYQGITTPSKRILFIIDQSGSMEDEVLEKKRFEGRNYPNFTKLEIAKQELIRTLKNLDPSVKFNVLTFATLVFSWKRQLQSANVLGKTSSVDYVERLKPIGGSSKAALAGAGLVGAAGMEEGKTNTYLALMTGLGGPGGRTLGDVAEDVDTIFFLSDGRPSVGKLIEPDDILGAVREVNKLKKIVIHAIAIGEFQKDFMEALAKENGGVFVDLGK